MRVTRREFAGGMAAAGFALAVRPLDARGAEPVVLRCGNGAGITDAQLSFVTIGKHPKLNFYKPEGVDTEIVNMQGTSQTLQALATKSVDYSALASMTYPPIVAKNPSLDLVSAFVFLPQIHVLVGVKPDSPYQSIAELKGKKVGIRNQGDTGYFGIQVMFKELGVDPKTDVDFVSVGSGGPAGAALYNGSIEAISIWDAELARVEMAGFKLRYLPNTPGMQRMLGTTWGVSRTGLAERRALFAGFFRGMAKSMVFAHANPALAIRLHWEVYPETKPKGLSDDEAFTQALYVINARKEKWFPGPFQKDKRIGGSTLEDWQEMVRYTGLMDPKIPAVITDASRLFSNDIIDDANAFDRAEIEKMATTMKL